MRRLSCILKRFPGYFQQEPLLGIHTACFPRRDAEEVRVELIHMFQKAAPASAYSSGCAWIWVVEGVDIPTINWDLSDGA